MKLYTNTQAFARKTIAAITNLFHRIIGASRADIHTLEEKLKTDMAAIRAEAKADAPKAEIAMRAAFDAEITLLRKTIEQAIENRSNEVEVLVATFEHKLSKDVTNTRIDLENSIDTVSRDLRGVRADLDENAEAVSRRCRAETVKFLNGLRNVQDFVNCGSVDCGSMDERTQ